MDYLYTKNGHPLKVRGDRIYNPNGENFGTIRNDKVYGMDGRYRGTVVSDRLIYRSSQAGSVGPAKAPSGEIGTSGKAMRGVSGAWGDEPNTDR